MVTEMILFVNLKQWRKDFPIVTRNNCKNLRKTQKTPTPRKALKPGIPFEQPGLKKKDTVRILSATKPRNLMRNYRSFSPR